MYLFTCLFVCLFIYLCIYFFLSLQCLFVLLVFVLWLLILFLLFIGLFFCMLLSLSCLASSLFILRAVFISLYVGLGLIFHWSKIKISYFGVVYKFLSVGMELAVSKEIFIILSI